MSETITRRDPVQGLVDFVLDVKPFHTKILEVWVEYIYGDLIAATVKDEVDFEIHVDFNRIEPCKYGWDTTPWDKFWNIKDESELPQGVIEFIDNGVKKTIAEFDAYRLFFEYLSALWISRTTELIEPKADASENNPFRILWLPQSNGSGLVVSKCGEYWATTVLSNQFWFDPRHKNCIATRVTNGSSNRSFTLRLFRWTSKLVIIGSVLDQINCTLASKMVGLKFVSSTLRTMFLKQLQLIPILG